MQLGATTWVCSKVESSWWYLPHGIYPQEGAIQVQEYPGLCALSIQWEQKFGLHSRNRDKDVRRSGSLKGIMIFIGNQEPDEKLRKEGYTVILKFHPSVRVQRKSGHLLQIIKLSPPQQEPYLGTAIEAARVPVGTSRSRHHLTSRTLTLSVICWSGSSWNSRVEHRGPAYG